MPPGPVLRSHSPLWTSRGENLRLRPGPSYALHLHHWRSLWSLGGRSKFLLAHPTSEETLWLRSSLVGSSAQLLKRLERILLA
jgi:hypothetical protein